MHALGMRATSMGASVLVIGAALILALSASYTVTRWDIAVDGPPPIDVEQIKIEPPTPPKPIERDPPPTWPIEPTTITEFQPIDPTQTGQETFIETNLGAGGSSVVEITNPYWRRRPSDLGRFYPARALQRGVEGRAELDCLVSITGSLACTVISETPANWGFGDAAVRISREHQMVPATAAGQPAQGRYRMSVPFTLR